jgi:hypothetical protein
VCACVCGCVFVRVCLWVCVCVQEFNYSALNFIRAGIPGVSENMGFPPPLLQVRAHVCARAHLCSCACVGAAGLGRIRTLLCCAGKLGRSRHRRIPACTAAAQRPRRPTRCSGRCTRVRLADVTRLRHKTRA